MIFDVLHRDRTAEIRAQSKFECRHLGPYQMTADTAVIVSKRIIQDGWKLGELAFADQPSIKIRKNEYIDMPFRYLATSEGQPMLPKGMVDLWKRDEQIF